jgi:Protein of unknown function (DUF1275)
VSFLGLGHVFTANMTGNVVLLGFATVGVPGLSIRRSLTALGAFVVGAAVGGHLGTALAATDRRRWLLATALTEAVLLIVSVVGTVGVDVDCFRPGSRLYAAIRSTPVSPTSSQASHRGAIRYVASSATGRVGRTHSQTSPRIRAEGRWPSGSTSCEATAVPSPRGTAVAF